MQMYDQIREEEEKGKSRARKNTNDSMPKQATIDTEGKRNRTG